MQNTTYFTSAQEALRKKAELAAEHYHNARADATTVFQSGSFWSWEPGAKEHRAALEASYREVVRAKQAWDLASDAVLAYEREWNMA